MNFKAIWLKKLGTDFAEPDGRKLALELHKTCCADWTYMWIYGCVPNSTPTSWFIMRASASLLLIPTTTFVLTLFCCKTYFLLQTASSCMNFFFQSKNIEIDCFTLGRHVLHDGGLFLMIAVDFLNNHIQY